VFNAHGIETQIVAGVSEPEHVQLATEFGGIVAEVPNLPLGNKWNHVTNRAHQLKPDYFFIVGSDDFFSNGVLEKYIPFMRDGFPYIGIADMYFCEPASQRAAHYLGYPEDHALFAQPVGSGRMIRADLLPKRPWKWFAEIGLDGDITTLLMDSPRVLIPVSLEAPAVDVKTGTNMWSFDKLQQSYKGTVLEPAVFDEVLAGLPEGPEITALCSTPHLTQE
jgi:hypothetical protein